MPVILDKTFDFFTRESFRPFQWEVGMQEVSGQRQGPGLKDAHVLRRAAAQHRSVSMALVK